MQESGEIVIFNVGDLICGLDTAGVREIIKEYTVTSIHHSPPFVRGVINLRGDIVTVIDLKIKFGIKRTEENVENIIVVSFHGENVGLLTDSIDDIIPVDQDCVEPPPSNIGGLAGSLLSGVYKLEEGLAVILDVDGVLRKE